MLITNERNYLDYVYMKNPVHLFFGKDIHYHYIISNKRVIGNVLTSFLYTVQ